MEAILVLLRPFLTKFDGYKTYIGGAGFMALALYYLLGANPDYAQAATYFSLALTAMGLRHAVSKATE